MLKVNMLKAKAGPRCNQNMMLNVKAKLIYLTLTKLVASTFNGGHVVAILDNLIVALA